MSATVKTIDVGPGDMIRLRVGLRVIDVACDRRTGCVGIGEPTGCWMPPEEPDHIGTMPVLENHQDQSDLGRQAAVIRGSEEIDPEWIHVTDAAAAIRLLCRLALREMNSLRVIGSYVEHPSFSLRDHATFLGIPKSTIDDTMRQINVLVPGVERLLKETTKASLGQKARRKREAQCKL